MREIKFRAWDKERGVMYLVGAITFNANGKFDGTLVLDDEEWINRQGELMQYTGLLDKNGKEIYEGDVVQHRRLTRPGDSSMYGIAEQMQRNLREVKFEACGFTPFAGWIESANNDLEWEIIGNIYENPELLK